MEHNDARAGGGGRSVGGAAGGLIAWFAMLVWGPIATLWASGSIVALAKRWRWAYPSVVAYWVGNILVCLCSPFGLVGLLHALLSKAGRWTVATNHDAHFR